MNTEDFCEHVHQNRLVFPSVDKLIIDNYIMKAEVQRLRAALKDEYAGHEAYVNNVSCDAGNFDGGNSRDCEHCQHQRRLNVLDALLPND